MASDIPAAASDAHNAVSAIVDAAVETADEIAERAIDAAAERVTAAERVAEDLTLAALQTQLGQQLNALREDVAAWQLENSRQLSSLENRLMSVEQKQVEPPTVVAVTTTTPADQSSLIPPVSVDPQQATTTVAVVDPASVAEAVPVAVATVPAAAAKKARRLM